MLLGVVINDKGLVPDADVARAEAFGNEIHRLFDHPIKEISGKGKTITSSNGSNEVIYEIRFDQPTSVSHAVMQEEIAKGERVLSYRLEGETSGNWEKIAEGTNIGHKRIEMFDPRNVSAVRLVVTSYKAEPKMKAFKIY